MEEESKKKARRQFDQEFKKDAVRLVETSNLSVEKVARESKYLKRQPYPTGFKKPEKKDNKI